MCVTGYTQDQRADLEAKVVANGGAYCPDLVRDACTHLVASSTTSAKFKHASKWPGVCVVKREWVDASIRDGRRADESLFVVRKETEAEAALAALKREREEDAATPWDACYLLGCRVCLYDLGAPKTSEPAKRAARLLRRGAGAVTTNPAKATHVVVSKSAAVGSLKAIKEHRDKVVYTSWLEACDVEMDVVDMDEHLVHAEMFSGGGNAAARPIAAAAVGERFNLSQEAASQGMSKGKSKPRARPAAEQEEPRRREGPASPNPLTRQALAATAAAEAQALSEAAAAKATEVGDQNVPPIESTRAKVNANDVGCSYDPATGTELPATAIAIPETRAAAKDDGEGEGEGGSGGPFEGMSIGLSRLLSKEEDDAARDFIAHGGGIAVTMPTESDGRWASSASSTSYVVCPAAPTAEERKVLNAAPESARKHVTCHWLERCVEAGLAIPLSGDAGLNPAYRPLPCDAPLESMQRLRVSTSLYDESVKESVHMLCRLLGAKYTDNLRRNKNTHLVVPTAEGTKYEAAKKWGLHVVTVEWLHACVKAGRRVSEVDFPPPARARRRRRRRRRGAAAAARAKVRFETRAAAVEQPRRDARLVERAARVAAGAAAVVLGRRGAATDEPTVVADGFAKASGVTDGGARSSGRAGAATRPRLGRDDARWPGRGVSERSRRHPASGGCDRTREGVSRETRDAAHRMGASSSRTSSTTSREV